MKWFFGAYLLVAGILTIWGSMQGTGLPGWLLALEVETLGRGSMKLTALLSFIIYCLPLLAVLALLQKLAPLEVEELNNSLQAQQRQQQQAAVHVDPPDVRPIKTWGGILKLTFILLAITLVSTAFVYVRTRQSEKAEVFRVTVSDLPATGKIPSWERIELTGTIPRGVYAAYREGSFHHVYLPVTPANWSKANPVRAFVHHKAYAEPKQQISLPGELESPGPLTVKGTRGGAMPVFAQRMLHGQGAQLHPDPVIIDWNPREPNHETFPEAALMPLVLGLFATTIIVGVMSIAKTGLLQPRPRRHRLTGFEGIWREEQESANSAEQAKELSVYWGQDNSLQAVQLFRQGDLILRRPAHGVRTSGNTLYIETAGAFHQIDPVTMRQQQSGTIWKKINSTPL